MPCWSAAKTQPIISLKLHESEMRMELEIHSSDATTQINGRRIDFAKFISANPLKAPDEFN